MQHENSKNTLPSLTNYYSYSYSREVEDKVKIERNATITLRKALENCKGCQIKKPECSDDPPICFPTVVCRDTFDGPVCGPCPQGWCGDGKVEKSFKLTHTRHHKNNLQIFMTSNPRL